MRDAPVLLHRSLLRNPWPKPTGVLEHCREGKPTVGTPFFGVFPSDRIPKATKAVHVRFFIHSNNSCKLYKRISGNFEATTYMHHRMVLTFLVLVDFTVL